jgi:hypothetical protein
MKRISLVLALLALCFNAHALDTGDLTVKGDVALSKYTTNGFLKTTGGTGTLAIDTTTIVPSLKIDQTTPETVINGTPVFDEGLSIGGRVGDTATMDRTANIFSLRNVVTYLPATSYGYQTIRDGASSFHFDDAVNGVNQSISFWFRKTAGADTSYLLCYTGGSEIWISVDVDVIKFRWMDNSDAVYDLVTGPAVVDGTWYNIVATLSTNTLYLYVNGVTYGPTAITTPATSALQMYIVNGGDGDGNTTVVDDFVMWAGRTLTATEATDIYNAGVGLRAGPATVFPNALTTMGTNMSVCYNCDENTGLVLTDTSGNANNATIAAGSWTTGFGFGTEDIEIDVIQAENGTVVGDLGIITIGDNSKIVLNGTATVDGDLVVSGTVSGGLGAYVKLDQSTPQTLTGGSPIIAENLKFKTSVIATGHKAGVTATLSTVTHLDSSLLAFGVIQKTIDDPADQNGTLDNGVVGQMVTIQVLTKAAGNYILTPTTKTGYTSLTFDTAKDSITLLYLDNTNGWIIAGNNGVTVN